MPPDGQGRPEIEKGVSLPSLVCVEHALIPIQGGFPARDLTRVEKFIPQPSKVTSQPGCVETGATVNRSHLMTENGSDEPLTTPKPTFIGISETASEARVNLVNTGGESGAESPTVRRRKRRNLRPLWNLNSTLETGLWYFHQILPRLDHRCELLNLDGNVLKSLLGVAM